MAAGQEAAAVHALAKTQGVAFSILRRNIGLERCWGGRTFLHLMRWLVSF